MQDVHSVANALELQVAKETLSQSGHHDLNMTQSGDFSSYCCHEVVAGNMYEDSRCLNKCKPSAAAKNIAKSSFWVTTPDRCVCMSTMDAALRTPPHALHNTKPAQAQRHAAYLGRTSCVAGHVDFQCFWGTLHRVAGFGCVSCIQALASCHVCHIVCGRQDVVSNDGVDCIRSVA